jgi:hypothetical protein
MPEDNQDLENLEHNEEWKARKSYVNELRKKHVEEAEQEAKRKMEVEEAILEIARCQKAILKELACIREYLFLKNS